MSGIPPVLNVKTNPTGYMAAAGAIYAAVAMIWNARYHHGVIDTPVIIAALAAIASLLTRQIVTPVAAPKDGAGNPLVPLPPGLPVAGFSPSGSVRLVPPAPPAPPPGSGS